MTTVSLTRRHILRATAAAPLLAAAPALAGRAWAQSTRMPKFILDSQVNVWTGGKPPVTRHQGPFLPSDLLAAMNGAGVTRAILVPVSWNPDGEKTPLAAAHDNPDRFRVFSIYNVDKAPDPAELMKKPGVLGLRLFLRNPKYLEWAAGPDAAPFWESVQKNNIPIMFYPPALDVLHQIATAYPNAKLCIDSLGAPDKPAPGAFVGYDKVLAMAKLPNVSIKCSELVQKSQQPYPYADLVPTLHSVYDAFGPERMFWGSDLTVLEPVHITYKQCITFFTEQKWLSDSDLDLIMGKAFSKWANWPIPT